MARGLNNPKPERKPRVSTSWPVLKIARGPGTVQNASGATIPDATVTLVNQATQIDSLEAQELSVRLPKDWKATEVRARLLTATVSQEISVSIAGDSASVKVPARQPVRIYRASPAVRKS
jgi:hypothetical protein